MVMTPAIQNILYGIMAGGMLALFAVSILLLDNMINSLTETYYQIAYYKGYQDTTGRGHYGYSTCGGTTSPSRIIAYLTAFHYKRCFGVECVEIVSHSRRNGSRLLYHWDNSDQCLTQ